MRLAEYGYEYLKIFYSRAKEEYQAYVNDGLQIDMSRGKPSEEQLELSEGLYSIAIDKDYMDGSIDVRNYGALPGIPSCRKLFADILGVSSENIFVGGNSSLSLMYDVISKAYTHGLLRSEKPWCKHDTLRFLCPSPGYDRHFMITQSFGFELIPIPMLQDGPDMDLIENLVRDPSVKGIWCVPRFSNPDGVTYSAEMVRRFAYLKPAADDFLIMWDNAYCVHSFYGVYTEFPEILSECAAAGRPDMVIEFTSTSKITLPGAGISCMAANTDMMEYLLKLNSIQSISYDKVNQLRHVKFLKDKITTMRHMKKHADIMKPKFEIVINALTKEIEPLDIAHFSKPAGGYFISLYVMKGTAKRVHQLMKEAGIIMTPAGATYPYGKDPDDSNLRIAPSFVSETEVHKAISVLCTCIKLSAAEKLLAIDL